jgi:hypothetical protein
MKIITGLFLLSYLNGFTQRQERTLLIYNAGFGGISSGIGAAINKPKDINWKKAFIKGFWQGSIGGLVNYSSKKTLYLINKNQNYIYAWPAKLLHAASNSIIENAALHEPFLQNWNIDFGLVRVDFSFNSEKKIKARFLPETIFAIVAGSKYGKFDLRTSLETGQIIYSTTGLFNVHHLISAGATFGRSSVYIDGDYELNKYRVIAHELVHQFQYTEYLVFNTWLKPLANKVKSPTLNTLFSKYIYLDIPYFFIPYFIDGVHADPHYYRNFYEFEADRFATNKFVQR